MKTGKRFEELASQEAGGSYPPCCYHNPDNGHGAALYAAYNTGGDPDTAGLNFRGEPCPMWEDLPQNIRDKWDAVAQYVAIDKAGLFGSSI